jgi:hypothetical protein
VPYAGQNHRGTYNPLKNNKFRSGSVMIKCLPGTPWLRIEPQGVLPQANLPLVSIDTKLGIN